METLEGEQETFHCGKCDSGPLRKLKHLRYHEETVHSEIRSYVCSLCGASYKRSSHLRRHQQNTHSTDAIQCEWPDCDKRFKGKEQLRRHMRRHETKGSYQCKLCGKSFSKKRQLESHNTKTHGPFECGACGAAFTTKQDFRSHSKAVHGDTSHPIECKHCDLNFGTHAELQLHVKTDHVNFPCPECPSVFTRARALKAHYLSKHATAESSENETRLKLSTTCKLCGIRFSSVSNMRCHMRTVHNNERNFECEICLKQFAHKHVLQRHVRSVHEDLPSSLLQPTPDDSFEPVSATTPCANKYLPLFTVCVDGP